jgi:hypothetical protein
MVRAERAGRMVIGGMPEEGSGRARRKRERPMTSGFWAVEMVLEFLEW